MKLGLRLPQRLGVDLQHDVVEAARTAEAAGYASLWTYERLLFPQTPLEPYAPPDVPWPESSRQVADSLAVLTAAAVVTEKVRLGTAILIAAQHTPVQLAKALATIDQISGGRMIAGMGPGWSSDDLRATGATRADRGRFLDETLDVFDAVWGPDPVTFRSPRVVIDNASVLPKPASKIPVMLGGGGSNLGRSTSPKAVQRIAKRADGWLPLLTTPGPAGAAELRASWDRIREMASEYGRDTEPDGDGRGRKRHLHRPSGRTRPIGIRRHTRPNHGRCPNSCRGRRRRAHHGSEPAGLVHQHSADARDGGRDPRTGRCLMT